MEELLKRLSAEQNRWFGQPDLNTVRDLKNELDYTVGERNTLIRRVRELRQELNASSAALARSRQTIIESEAYLDRLDRNRLYGGSAGFVTGGVGGVWYGLASIWTVATAGAGAVLGVIAGTLLTKDDRQND